MSSYQSSSAENVSCNVAPFFYHHSVVIQHLVSDTLYHTCYFRSIQRKTYIMLDKILLAHLAQRARWAFAITWHPSSLSVIRRKLFQRSSPLKLLDQLEPNLVWIITKVSSFQNCVRWCCEPINMAAVTKNRTYGKIAGFWVIT
jgi:hypothetical protein